MVGVAHRVLLPGGEAAEEADAPFVAEGVVERFEASRSGHYRLAVGSTGPVSSPGGLNPVPRPERWGWTVCRSPRSKPRPGLPVQETTWVFLLRRLPPAYPSL